MSSPRKLLAHLPWTRSGPYVMVGGALVVRPAHPRRYANLPVHSVDPGRLDAYFSAAFTDPAVVVRVSPARVLGLRASTFSPQMGTHAWVAFEGALFDALHALAGKVTRYRMMIHDEPDTLVAMRGPRVVGMLLPLRPPPTRAESHEADAKARALHADALQIVERSTNPFLSVTTEA